ncbi:fasciclin domain-containing protein [Aliidiomarina halalkaliphila]|uniref:Fasciclin domain-containing protein n=1 Tax=Aliidiomarina halalkaliphila TaxID=2593535 RepID=A0A552X3Z2_9GAMM|nr:fasciclin domain-containing protein [Aliidiomarina halalkaliphila]TRW49750.1 fasciclin domain-containing protein [Aliidiomarina halalkaliphila]
MKHLTRNAITTVLVSLFALSGAAIAHNHGGDRDKEKEKSEYSSYQDKKGSITDIAAGNDKFTILVAALGAADLIDALNGEGPFTVFAPTDEAFAALPEGTLESLLQPENREQLTAILTYHVVSGEVSSDDIADQSLYAETLQGQSLAIDATGYGVRINGGARVVTADIQADNGVIHVIDTVLIPTERSAASY